MVGAGAPGQLRLFLSRYGGEHVAAQPFNHLYQQQPDTASPGVNQNLIPWLHRVGGMAEVMRGHTLEHYGRSVPGVQSLRHCYQAGGRHHRLLGVGALAAAVGNHISFP